MLNPVLSLDNYLEHPLYDEWKEECDSEYTLEGYEEYEMFLTWLEDL